MKPIALKDDEFKAQLKGKSIDVAKLEADARMKGVDVKGADLNGDGVIEGAKEQQALFTKLDAFDNDGKDRTVRLIDGGGSVTAMYGRMTAISEIAGLDATRSLAMVGGPPKSNDDVMHIGMRDASSSEVAAIQKQMKGDRKLVTVGSKTHAGFTASDGAKYDLTNRTEIDGFVKTLGLPAAQSKSIADAIEKTYERGRDEMAAIATEWAKAELGGRIPSRLSVSGHHVGGDFWGENGMISRDSLIDLAAAMPKAAAQIEDIHLSACYCQGRNGVRKWLAAFPQAKTILAYADGSPSAEQGAGKLQAKWERATRGDSQNVQSEVSGSVVWTRKNGFKDGLRDTPLADLKAERASRRADFDKYFAGDLVVTDHATGPLREYYARVTELAAHPDLSKADAKKFEDEAKVTIRLIYFDKIAPQWAAANQALITDGYAAAKLTAPDFAKASRKDAVKYIDDFMTKTAGSKDPKVLALQAELQTLKNLDAEKLQQWI